jgi:hypothetical protein
MSEVDRLLWQTEFFLSMSTKVADPSLAETLQQAAGNYLIKATEAVQLQQAGRTEGFISPTRAR